MEFFVLNLNLSIGRKTFGFVYLFLAELNKIVLNKKRKSVKKSFTSRESLTAQLRNSKLESKLQMEKLYLEWQSRKNHEKFAR